jgi:ubiquinone/menaquinone biosynthesis C-methylase UbiE
MSTSTPERTPFAEVDGLPPEMATLVIAALDGMAARPEIQRVRSVARAALALAPGQRILDAGCGAGEEARRLAAAVAPDGEVVALDLSATTVALAQDRHDGGDVAYRTGDVTALDLADGMFDGVRCERVLQHLADPDGAVGELARVTRAGGRVCLVDTDWESLAGDGVPDDMAAALRAHLYESDRLHHASMGRTLRRRLVRAGLGEVVAEPVQLTYTDPAEASAVIPVFNRAIPAEANMLPVDLVEPWFAAVDAAAERGEFLVTLTIWVAAGTKR